MSVESSTIMATTAAITSFYNIAALAAMIVEDSRDI